MHLGHFLTKTSKVLNTSGVLIPPPALQALPPHVRKNRHHRRIINASCGDASISDRVEGTIGSIRGNLMPQQRVLLLRGVMGEAGLIAKEDLSEEEMDLEEDEASIRLSAFVGHIEQRGPADQISGEEGAEAQEEKGRRMRARKGAREERNSIRSRKRGPQPFDPFAA